MDKLKMQFDDGRPMFLFYQGDIPVGYFSLAKCSDEEWELNRRLQILHKLTANSRLARANTVDINVEYYAMCTDSENDAYMIKGQTEQLSEDIHNAILMGVNYGKYMGMKHDKLAIALKRV